MKKIKPILFTMAGIFLFTVSGCMTSYNKLITSNDIPAAQGGVTFSKLDDGNTGIDINIRHLAPSWKVSNEANNYVVWVQRDKESPPQNVGMMKVYDGRHARLKTKTPLHSFDLFITTESTGQVLTPSGEKLMWTSYSY